MSTFSASWWAWCGNSIENHGALIAQYYRLGSGRRRLLGDVSGPDSLANTMFEMPAMDAIPKQDLVLNQDQDQEQDQDRNRVLLFTDGACKGNPGPGGWAFILRHPATGQEKQACGAEPQTTNNRMELMGVIRGLATLKRSCAVELVTDSQYVAKGISEWMPKWKSQGWQRREGKSLKPVMNVDLWQELDRLVLLHNVKVSHVLGHNGHPENEACDRLAVQAYQTLISESATN